MRFSLRQLRYFVAAGEAGSILKASESVHVSQPSISSAISQLEDTFGLQLFVRVHAQGMSLTPEGREMMHKVKELLNQSDELQEFAGELSGRVAGNIELGCFNPLAPIVAPSLCREFSGQHEDISIRIREAHQADLLQLLRQGAIDIALTYDLQLTTDLDFIPLAELPPYALIGPDHPLALQAAASLEDLAEQPLVLLDLPLSSEYFMSLFSVKGLKPNIAHRTRLTDVQRGMVASGQGYSLANVRPSNTRSLDGSPLCYLPLEGKHMPLTIGIAALREGVTSAACSTFVEFCRQSISNESIPGMVNLPAG